MCPSAPARAAAPGLVPARARDAAFGPNLALALDLAPAPEGRR